MERPLPHNASGHYLSLVPEGDLVVHYTQQMDTVSSMLSHLNNQDAMFRYAPGKWSVKEVIGHLIDTERVCSYRLLCAARRDITPMPFFDEESFVIEGGFHSRVIAEINEEWRAVRLSTISLIKSLSPESLYHEGRFKERNTTALEIACIILGHANHHINVLHHKYNVISQNK